MYTSISAARVKRIVGVTLGLLWLTVRQQNASAPCQRPRQVTALRRRHGVVGPAAGGSEIPACQRGLGTPVAPHRAHLTYDIDVLPRGLNRLLRPRAIPGGQGRKSHQVVSHSHEHLAKLRAGLKRRLRRRSGRCRLALVREYNAPAPEAAHPPHLIVSRLALDRHLAQLFDTSG